MKKPIPIGVLAEGDREQRVGPATDEEDRFAGQ
jgi:hypothetical protein